jgi:hypothetical protein
MLFDEQLHNILYHRATSEDDGEPVELSEGTIILLFAFLLVFLFFTFRVIVHIEREDMKARKGL